MIDVSTYLSVASQTGPTTRHIRILAATAQHLQPWWDDVPDHQALTMLLADLSDPFGCILACWPKLTCGSIVSVDLGSMGATRLFIACAERQQLRHGLVAIRAIAHPYLLSGPQDPDTANLAIFTCGTAWIARQFRPRQPDDVRVAA
jgi:hypothetical protein